MLGFFFQKLNKIDKLLVKLEKKERECIITKIGN